MKVQNRVYFLLSFFSSLFISYGLALVLIPPINQESVVQKNILEYPVPIEILQPEPHEFMRYILFWLFFTMLFLIFYMGMSRFNVLSIAEKIDKHLILVSCFGCSFFFFYCFLKKEWDYTKTFKERFYINNTLFSSPVLCLFVTLAAIMMLYLIRRKQINWLIDEKWNWLICYIISLLVSIYAAIFVCKPNPFYNPNALSHDSYYFTSIYNVYYGGSLGVEASTVYGAQAYLIVPILKLIGFSYHRFVFVMGVLCFIIFVGIFFIVKELVKKPILTLMSFLFIIYTMVFYTFALHGGFFFYQHVPNRVLFPVIMICYVIFSKKIIRKRNIYVICGYLLSVISLIMNIESGLAVLGAFFISEVVLLFSLHSLKKIQFYKKLTLNFVAVVLSIITFLGIMWSIAFIRSGECISLTNLYITQFVFSKLGYGMLPLPSGMSMYMAVFSLVAFFVAIILKLIINGKIHHEHLVLSAITSISVILLIYYIGRTDTRTLIPVIWGPQLLLCYLVSRINEKEISINISKIEKLSAKIISYPLLIVISLYAISIPYTIGTTNSISSYIYSQRVHEVPHQYIDEMDIINKYSTGDKTVNLVSNYASVILAEMGKKNSYLGECCNDLYTFEAYDYLLGYIEKVCIKKEPLLLDGYTISQLNRYVPERFNSILEKNLYRISEEAGSIKVFTPNNNSFKQEVN